MAAYEGQTGAVGWLFNWDEATKRPWAAVITVALSGLIGGGVVGYVRFGDSVAYGAVLGLGVALVLGAITWPNVHDPARAAELTERRTHSLGKWLRLAFPFIALGVAAIVGAAAASVSVFVVTLAVGLAAGLVLRTFVLR